MAQVAELREDQKKAMEGKKKAELMPLTKFQGPGGLAAAAAAAKKKREEEKKKAEEEAKAKEVKPETEASYKRIYGKKK